jgi:hypothetical protein
MKEAHVGVPAATTETEVKTGSEIRKVVQVQVCCGVSHIYVDKGILYTTAYIYVLYIAH